MTKRCQFPCQACQNRTYWYAGICSYQFTYSTNKHRTFLFFDVYLHCLVFPPFRDSLRRDLYLSHDFSYHSANVGCCNYFSSYARWQHETTTRTHDAMTSGVCIVNLVANVLYLFMAALRRRCGHYIFALWFLSSIFFFSSPNLSRRRLAVYHTCTWCGLSANLRRRSETCCTALAEIQDAKSRQKIAIWAPSHNFVGLYLLN